MFKSITIPLGERVVVFKNGVPVQFLGPGKHTLWGSGKTTTRIKIDSLIVDLPPEVRAIIPAEAIETVTVGNRQRALLYFEGAPKRYLRPGTHRFWTLAGSVTLRAFSIDEDVPDLTGSELALIPNTDLCVATILQNQRGLLYEQGRFVSTLAPGRYVRWSPPNAAVVIKALDMRQKQVTITGQDLMTRDKVTLRLTLTAEYVPADAATLVHSVVDVDASIYLLIQLAARDYVAAVSLDELLEGRERFSAYLAEKTVIRAREIGVELRRIGVKDIILPGEMKVLLNRVIEAEKQADANVILRREEVASTRTMANAAKVVAQNPMLLKLKELDTLKEVAERIDEVRLFVGDGGLKSLIGSEPGNTNGVGTSPRK